jgi:hypothetical protein
VVSSSWPKAFTVAFSVFLAGLHAGRHELAGTLDLREALRVKNVMWGALSGKQIFKKRTIAGNVVRAFYLYWLFTGIQPILYCMALSIF